MEIVIRINSEFDILRKNMDIKCENLRITDYSGLMPCNPCVCLFLCFQEH